MSEPILVYAQEAGTAAALLPVMKALINQGHRLDIYALPPADRILASHFPNVRQWEGFSSCSYQLLICGYGHPKVTVNQSILSEAINLQLPTLAILDNWKGLDRFFTVDGSVSPALPDILAVMDEFTKTVLVQRGIPSDQIIVTGHPGLEEFGNRAASTEDGIKIREKLGLPLDRPIYLLASERLHSHSFFNGCDASCGNLFFMDVEQKPLWKHLKDECRENAVLMMRLHPNEQEIKDKDIRIIQWHEIEEAQLLKIVDRVYGLSSMLLFISVAMGIPTINVSPYLRKWHPSQSYLTDEIWDYLIHSGYLGKYKRIASQSPDMKGALKSILTVINNQCV